MSEPSAPTADEASTALTTDWLLGGRVQVRQPLNGYRAGLDAALLAASLELSPGERAVEAGCGVGGALLQAASRFGRTQFVGVERDQAAAALAHVNVNGNGVEGRVSILEGDVAQPPAKLFAEPFDHAFANPPFFDDPTALRGPAPERRGAWLADDGLEAWTAFLLRAVKPGGRVTMIHRADRLGDLLRLLSDGGGSLQVRGVHPRADAPAKRVLVRAVKGGRAPLRLLAPLVLHGGDGGWTQQADGILRGEAALPFDDPPSPDGRIKVRAYRLEDAEPLLNLFRRSVRVAAAGHYSLEQLAAWAPDELPLAPFAERRAAKPCWVAEVDGVLAGFIDLEPDGHIDMLYVSADHQRLGVASRLYAVVEATASGRGVPRLFTEASKAARPFFESRGFTLITEQLVEVRGQRLVNYRMEKRLDQSA
ncbi:hypothetical protein BH09PSE2_BH09PSE2_12140 [soil metagenome]